MSLQVAGQFMLELKGFATVRAGEGLGRYVVVAVILSGHGIQELLGAQQAIVALCFTGVVVQGAFGLAGLITMAAGKGVALWLGLWGAVSIVPAIHMTRSIGLAAAKVARTYGDTVC